MPCSAPPECEACSTGRGYSAAYLLALLEHPDVAPALARNASFGAAIGPNGAGFFFRVNVGNDSITIHNPCLGSSPDCMDAPAGVRELRQVLDDIATQQACEPTASACQQPFDPGTGSDTVGVYAFHAQTGTCVPQLYTGAGGNANRFDDLQSCRAACPNTASESSCPPNRLFQDDLCLQCGPTGGCGNTEPGCALLCATAAGCADEFPDAMCSPRGVCEVASCI
jgi:hypothetical protein